MAIVPYQPRHLDAILGLCKEEGWTSFAANHERAARAMTGPGVTALVAVEDRDDGGAVDEERLLGFAQAVGDGCFGGYLCMLLVAAEARGRGIGRALIERTLIDSGVLRLDLLSSEKAMSLYERFPHNRIPGFRIYPDESLLPSKPGPEPPARSS
jgi:ribosomal protein S18 acetylase RimI-like enzyme